MISDQQIQNHLQQHGLEATRQWLIINHHPMHQTIEMKLVQLGKILAGVLG